FRFACQKACVAFRSRRGCGWCVRFAWNRSARASAESAHRRWAPRFDSRSRGRSRKDMQLTLAARILRGVIPSEAKDLQRENALQLEIPRFARDDKRLARSTDFTVDGSDKCAHRTARTSR